MKLRGIRGSGLAIAGIAVLGALAGGGCGGSDKEKAVAGGAAPLAAAQIREELPGNTLSGRDVQSGTPIDVYYAEDGTLLGRVADFRDTGRYRITDTGQLCGQWATLSKAEQCVELFRDGEEVRAFDGQGTSLFIAKIRPGDAEGLSAAPPPPPQQ